MGSLVTYKATATAATNPSTKPIIMPVKVPERLREERLRFLAIITFLGGRLPQVVPSRWQAPEPWQRPGSGGLSVVIVHRRVSARCYTKCENQPRNHVAKMPPDGGRARARPDESWLGTRPSAARARARSGQ